MSRLLGSATSGGPPMLVGVELPDGRRVLAAHDCAARCCGSFRLFISCCGDNSSFSRRWHPVGATCSGSGAAIVPGAVVFIGGICFRATDEVRPAAEIPPTDPVSLSLSLPCVSGCDEEPCPDCEPDCCWVTVIDTDCDLDVQEETQTCNCGEDFTATWDWQARIEHHRADPFGNTHDYVYTATGHHVETTTRNRDAEPQCLFNRQRSGYIDFAYTDTAGPSNSGRFSYPLPPPDEAIGDYLDSAGCGTIPFFLHTHAETYMVLTGLSYVRPSTLFGAACLTYPAPGPCNRSCSRTEVSGDPNGAHDTTVYTAVFSGGPGCTGSAPIVNASQASSGVSGTLSVSVHIQHVLSIEVHTPCGGTPVHPNVPTGGAIRPSRVRAQGSGGLI